VPLMVIGRLVKDWLFVGVEIVAAVVGGDSRIVPAIP
jgi:hypothetical protein